MGHCFATPKIFVIFARHEYGLKCYFGNPLHQFSQNRKWSLIVHVGRINENSGKNSILGY